MKRQRPEAAGDRLALADQSGCCEVAQLNGKARALPACHGRTRQRSPTRPTVHERRRDTAVLRLARTVCPAVQPTGTCGAPRRLRHRRFWWQPHRTRHDAPVPPHTGLRIGSDQAAAGHAVFSTRSRRALVVGLSSLHSNDKSCRSKGSTAGSRFNTHVVRRETCTIRARDNCFTATSCHSKQI